MRRLPALIAAATLAVPAVLALQTGPSGAGIVHPVVTGVAHCDLDTGHETYSLTWTVTNPFIADLTIDNAAETGAFVGTVDFTPNPIPGDSDASATGSDGPVPNTAGTVTLTVDWSGFESSPFGGTSVGTITLDGSCRLPATTSIAPTTTAQQAAIVVRPTFTG